MILHRFNLLLLHQQRQISVKAYIQRYRLLGPCLLDLVVHHGVVDSKSTEYNKCLQTRRWWRRWSWWFQVAWIYCSCNQSFWEFFTSKSLWSASLNVFLSRRFRIWATPSEKTHRLLTSVSKPIDRLCNLPIIWWVRFQMGTHKTDLMWKPEAWSACKRRMRRQRV